MHIWKIIVYLFKILKCERDFLNDDHKNIDLDWFPLMIWEYLLQPLLQDSQILHMENKHKSLTEWLTGWNCLSFLIKQS